jgi:hypothetical protein
MQALARIEAERTENLNDINIFNNLMTRNEEEHLEQYTRRVRQEYQRMDQSSTNQGDSDLSQDSLSSDLSEMD